MLRKMIDGLNRVIAVITMFLFATMTTLVIIQVVSRALTGYSFSWVEELTRFSVIWVTFLGAGLAFKYGAHISIEMLFYKIPLHLRKLAQWGITLLCSVFFVVVMVKGFQIVTLTMVQKSSSLQIPIGYVYSVIPFSGFYQMLNLIDVSINYMQTGKLPGEEVI